MNKNMQIETMNNIYEMLNAYYKEAQETFGPYNESSRSTCRIMAVKAFQNDIAEICTDWEISKQ